MGTTNGNLLGKFHNMKVTKCEVKLFENVIDVVFSFVFFIFFFLQKLSCDKTSLIQTSVIRNLSKSRFCLVPWKKFTKRYNTKFARLL